MLQKIFKGIMPLIDKDLIGSGINENEEVIFSKVEVSAQTFLRNIQILSKPRKGHTASLNAVLRA